MEKRNEIVLCTGEDILFHGIVHGSVGINYALEYDKTAFNENKVLSYTNPSRAHMCGGDKQDVIYTLTALKEGDFLIKEIEYFRGERTIIKENFVQVKGTRLSSANTYEEYACFDCGNVCSTRSCSKCGSNNVRIVELNEVYSERICEKCGYVTHTHDDFDYCPICGSLLKCSLVDPCAKELHKNHKEEPYIITSKESVIHLWVNRKELTPEVHDSLRIVRGLRIAKSKNSSFFGIVNTRGVILVNFIYDYIEPFTFTCLPGPGPLPPPDRWFIGAFFTRGNYVGWLRIRCDEYIEEYGSCTRKEYESKLRLT